MLTNPLYPTDLTTYKEYDNVMTGMEKELTIMHTMINTMNQKRLQMESLLALMNEPKYITLKPETQAYAQNSGAARNGFTFKT